MALLRKRLCSAPCLSVRQRRPFVGKTDRCAHYTGKTDVPLAQQDRQTCLLPRQDRQTCRLPRQDRQTCPFPRQDRCACRPDKTERCVHCPGKTDRCAPCPYKTDRQMFPSPSRWWRCGQSPKRGAKGNAVTGSPLPTVRSASVPSSASLLR